MISTNPRQLAELHADETSDGGREILNKVFYDYFKKLIFIEKNN